MENINKSIIYGNIHQNRYGKFLPICSSINDRCNHHLIQPTSLPSSIISIKAPISKNTTELPTPIVWRKSQSFLSPKKKMSKPSTTKISTVMQPLKAQAKSYFISLKNSVFFSLLRRQKCVYWLPDSAIQPSAPVWNHQLQGHRLKLSSASRWTLQKSPDSQR